MASTTKLYGAAASDTLDVTTITTETGTLADTPTPGTPDEITENGLDRLIEVNITSGSGISSVMIIPKPSQCPIGRKIMFDLRETQEGGYYWVQIKDQTDASNSQGNGYFISNADRRGSSSGDTYLLYTYAYEMIYADRAGPVLLTLTNNGTDWLMDDTNSGGSSSYFDSTWYPQYEDDPY